MSETIQKSTNHKIEFIYFQLKQEALKVYKKQLHHIFKTSLNLTKCDAMNTSILLHQFIQV